MLPRSAPRRARRSSIACSSWPIRAFDRGERRRGIALREPRYLGDRLLQRLARGRRPPRRAPPARPPPRPRRGRAPAAPAACCACSTRSFACVAANAWRRWLSSRCASSARAASICALQRLALPLGLGQQPLERCRIGRLVGARREQAELAGARRGLVRRARGQAPAAGRRSDARHRRGRAASARPGRPAAGCRSGRSPSIVISTGSTACSVCLRRSAGLPPICTRASASGSSVSATSVARASSAARLSSACRISRRRFFRPALRCCWRARSASSRSASSCCQPSAAALAAAWLAASADAATASSICTFAAASDATSSARSAACCSACASACRAIASAAFASRTRAASIIRPSRCSRAAASACGSRPACSAAKSCSKLPCSCSSRARSCSSSAALCFEPGDLVAQLRQLALEREIARLRLAAAVDQLEQRRLDRLEQRRPPVVADRLAELDIEAGLQRRPRAVAERRQVERAALRDPEHAPDVAVAAPAGLIERQQPLELGLGVVAVDPRAVRQVQMRERALQELLLDPIGPAVDLEIEAHARRGAMPARLKALHRPGVRAVLLEQRRDQGRQKGRLAHLVGPDDQVQAVAQPLDAHRPVELAELVELERAELHDASFWCSRNRRISASAATSRSGLASSSASSLSRAAAARTKPALAIASRSCGEGAR